MLNPNSSSLREQTAGLASWALENDLLDESESNALPDTPRSRRPGSIRFDSPDQLASLGVESVRSAHSAGRSFSNAVEEWPSSNAPVYPHRGSSSLSNIFKTKKVSLDSSESSAFNTSNYKPNGPRFYDDEGYSEDRSSGLETASDSPSAPLLGPIEPGQNGFHQSTLPPHLEYHTFNNNVPTEESPYFSGFRPASWTKRARIWATNNVTKDNVINECVKRPLGYIPSVILGVLLNILDGLSYGMILFPVAHPVFANLGPAGLSMFYVSCVVSQLVFSLGASAFHSGVGSEMIEVVPFFHAMATTLIAEIGEDRPQAIVATTILAYATSSVVTGLVFFILGYARLGSLVGFFPRHILVGCIGGVGWFLMVTGIEVSSRINGNIEYNWGTLEFLFNGITLLKWTAPLALALLLVYVQRFTHHPLLVPSYFIGVFAIFHLVVVAVPNLTFQDVRDAGWLFQGPTTSEPWWNFYTLYDFKAVDYLALLRTIPAMFALTFFGILHVPINVPALAASTGEDNVDVDRELLAHGISNALSGLLGSIQNYLVYTNSVLFIRSGADSRLSGVMLAIATFGVMIAGPGVIGFIPVMVVGALIFLLGIELIVEALVDTYGRVSRFEYFTIVVIVVTMGAWDFVIGIVVGIVLACVSFVIQAAQKSAIKGAYTGAVARSTVRRNAAQQRFLGEVGDQIFVLKLSGSIFFGTIVRIERAVRDLLDDAYFEAKPIRYLILDIPAVTAVDFSAAEAFARIKRLLDTKNVYMLICGATEDGSMIQALRAVGLLNKTDLQSGYSDDEEACKTGDDNDFEQSQVRLFPNLNSGLEWSENQFLKDYYLRRDRLKSMHASGDHKQPSSQQLLPPLGSSPQSSYKNQFLDIPSNGTSSGAGGSSFEIGGLAGSPRVAFLQQVADKTVREDPQIASSRWQHFKQPLPILMQTFQGLTDKRETFWFNVSSYFKREVLAAGTVLYSSDTEATGFYIVESGILRADYNLEQGELYESILAGTTCGELPFFSETTRTATVAAEVDTVVWKLDKESWRAMREQEGDGPEMAMELYHIALKLTVERFTSVMAYVLISANR